MRVKKVLGVLGLLLVVAGAGGYLFLRSLGMFASAPVYANGEGAIGGYDPVAYFTRGQPLIGSPEFTHDWNGASWRFASAAHRDEFALAPTKYAPQFGGYCAKAISDNYTARGDGRVWAIVDGKLYLNFDESVAREWSADRARRIASAEARWPTVLRD